jgi:glucosyl-dolichyl phosphate glucuronosyltransferase
MRGSPLTVNTFSVAICTRNRAALLAQSILAVFGQDYPKRCYELIVVDNGSTDNTSNIAATLATEAPVSFRFVVEPRVGVSSARNRAASEAAFDYVAYLDDDTIPNSDWLSAFNATIEEHRALVVGGRVEDVYEDDLSLPAWFACRYLRGFFRLDHDGKSSPVFRVRYPDYIGEGNCAYAKQLFERVQFPTKLGPAGDTRRTGEGAFLNLVLERAGVPIYYTDHAVVYHCISAARVTRANLIQASSSHGAEMARIEMEMSRQGTLKRVLRRTRDQLLQLPTPARPGVRWPRNQQTFCTFCKLVRTVAFVLESARLLAARSIGIDVTGDYVRSANAPRIG